MNNILIKLALSVILSFSVYTSCNYLLYIRENKKILKVNQLILKLTSEYFKSVEICEDKLIGFGLYLNTNLLDSKLTSYIKDLNINVIDKEKFDINYKFEITGNYEQFFYLITKTGVGV